MSKNLRLISWNVNGLRAVIRKNFFDFLNNDPANIICLQETKAQENNLDFQAKNPKDYDHNYLSSAQKKGYSGVAVYSQLKPLTVEKNIFKQEKFNQEGRVLKLNFENFILFNVYFPNGKASAQRLDYKMEFYEEFLKILKNLIAQNKKIIICGDVNTAHKPVDLARPDANKDKSGFLPKERAWIDKLIEAGFIDTFRQLHPDAKDKYSWWSYRTQARKRNVGWRIDYFYVSNNLQKQLKKAFILDEVTGSDHCPVGIELNFSH